MTPRPRPAPACSSSLRRAGARPGLLCLALLVAAASVQAARVRAASLPEVQLTTQRPGPITTAPAQPPAIELPAPRPAPPPGTNRTAPPSGPALGAYAQPTPPRLPARPSAPTRLSPALQAERQRLLKAAQPKTGFGTTAAAANAAWTLGLIELHFGTSSTAPSQAQTWFERAAQYGRQPLAQAGLAWCALDGCKGTPDPSAARQAIERLRPHHRARALYLQWLLERRLQPLSVYGNGPEGVSALRLPLHELLERAAAEGDTQARIELGIEAVTQGRLEDAQTHFKAAARHSQAATRNLETLTQEQARASAKAAAAPKDTSAEQLFEQARRAHRGVGAPPNYAQALRLYQSASAQGSTAARRMLALITSRLLPDGSVNPAWMAQLAWMDTANTLPRLDTQVLVPLMLREPSPLFDLLPAIWRQAF